MYSSSRIDAILQAEDIEGLLELGAPKDEYSHEAARIQSGLEGLRSDDPTEDQVSALIVSVWENAFDLSDQDIKKRSPAFRRVARQILETCLQSTEHSHP
ncbi:MAG: hypothetical protein JO182_21910 [Acidobacteriaceae bacterium]|nr:hypothetical protein [Acidobacteriaceae bacterium]MBV9037161.1 hypothetical protein [Acidobacteriaceae bacterium]MBV9223994.1 hypothetical protein [Acidobacteriaceae bacterium]MBV9306613.1 hypothetical protein [Acidobacteriaceae bacterium]MBV9678914.1 hypothetical protein [Acidobacteriaceae bacterium]